MAFPTTFVPRTSNRIHNALPNAPFISTNPYAKRYNTSRYYLALAPILAPATAHLHAAPRDIDSEEMSTVDYSDMPPLKYLETPPQRQQQQPEPEDDPMDIEEEEEEEEEMEVQQPVAAPNPRPYTVKIFLDSSSEESEDERASRSKAKAHRMRSTRTVIDLTGIDD